jgi:hypothetical protein
MTHRSKARPGFEDLIQRYSITRLLDVKRLSGSQLRVHDSGYIAVDIWTSGKYHIISAAYDELTSVRPIRWRKGGVARYLSRKLKSVVSWTGYFFTQMCSKKGD